MKNFVIYQFDHYSGLSQVIAMRCCWYADYKAVLVVPDVLGGNKKKIYTALVEKGIFDTVIYYDGMCNRMKNSKEEIRVSINNLFDERLKEKNILLQDAVDIYIGADIFNDFGIYLYEKKQKYSIYEFADKQLSLKEREQIAVNIGEASKEYGELLQESHALIGNEELVKEWILIDNDEKDKKNEGNRRRYVNFIELLKTIPDDKKRDILACFDVDTNLLKCEQILLPNSLGYSRNARVKDGTQLQDEKMGLIYQMLVDYFGEPNLELLIKPHPYNGIKFQEAFSDSIVLPQEFSMEFLHLLNDFCMESVLCISTSALEKIKGLYKNVWEGGMAFFGKWYNLHKFSGAIAIAKLLNIKGYYQLLLGQNKELFELFFSRTNKEAQLYGMNANIIAGRIFTIFDTCYSVNKYDIRNGLRNATNSINFYIGDDVEEFFENGFYDLISCCYPIKIKKYKLEERMLFSDENEEIMYLFVKDKNDWNAIRKENISYELKNTNLKITIECCDNDEVEQFHKQMYKKIFNKSVYIIEKELTILKNMTDNI